MFVVLGKGCNSFCQLTHPLFSLLGNLLLCNTYIYAKLVPSTGLTLPYGMSKRFLAIAITECISLQSSSYALMLSTSTGLCSLIMTD